MDDSGQINEKILSKLQGVNALRKLESAYRDYPTTFCSPDMKRLFLRFFDVTTVNVHYIEVVVRMKPTLGPEVAEKCEAHLEERLTGLLAEVDQELDGAAALMQSNGLTKEAKFLAQPLLFEVRVTSPLMRRYLKLMEKIDQLIRMIETLRIDGVLSTIQCDSRRMLLKRHIKMFAGAARRIAQELRASSLQSAGSAVKAKRSEIANANGSGPAQIEVTGNGHADGTSINGTAVLAAARTDSVLAAGETGESRTTAPPRSQETGVAVAAAAGV